MSTSVVELTNGYEINYGQTGDYGVRRFIDAAARPGVATTTLPAIGSTFSGLATGDYANMVLTNIKKIPWDADPTVGYEYICTYSQNTVTVDPLGREYDNLASIQTGAEYNSYTFPVTFSTGTSAANTNTVYFSTSTSGGSAIDTPVDAHVMVCLTNVSTTTRDRGTFASIVAEGIQYVGKINTGTWNGVNEGNVLCTGMQATPVEEITDGTRAVAYNKTLSFSIKSLPGDGVNNWQKVFYHGAFGRLARNANMTNPINLYDYASLPTTLS